MLNLFRGQLTRVIQTRRLFSTMRLPTSYPGDQRPLSQICESYPQTFPSFIKSQFLTQHIRFKSDIPSVHNEDKQISKGNNKGEEFIPVFTFPYVFQIALFCRMKVYLTGVSVMMIPMIAGSYLFTEIEPSTLVSVVMFIGFSLGTMTIFGEFFRRVVGRVYEADFGDE